MSQVKRFRADHRHVVETEFDDAQFVSVSDYDALQQRMTVAEQRADDMVYALARIQGMAEIFIDDGMHMPTPSIEAVRDIAEKAALNPATGRGGCGGGKPVPPSKPGAPPIRRVVNELVINKAEIEAHTTRNWRL